MIYAISVFVVVFILIGSALLLLFYRELLGNRIASVLAPRDAAIPEGPSKLTRAARSFRIFAGSIQKVVPKSEEETSRVRKRLIRAGFRDPHSANVLYAFKALLPLALCGVAFATGLYTWQPLVVFGGAALAGYLIPDFVLDHLI